MGRVLGLYLCHLYFDREISFPTSSPSSNFSSRTSHHIRCALVFCAVCCLVTLVVLKSDFCTCNNIDAAYLDGRNPGNPCDQTCRLGAAGYLIIVASVFWLAASWAVLRFGIQPDEAAHDAEDHMYDHYPIHSITSRMKRIVQGRSYQKWRRKVTTSDNVEEGDQRHDPCPLSAITKKRRLPQQQPKERRDQRGSCFIKYVDLGTYAHVQITKLCICPSYHILLL